MFQTSDVVRLLVLLRFNMYNNLVMFVLAVVTFHMTDIIVTTQLSVRTCMEPIATLTMKCLQICMYNFVLFWMPSSEL